MFEKYSRFSVGDILFLDIARFKISVWRVWICNWTFLKAKLLYPAKKETHHLDILQ